MSSPSLSRKRSRPDDWGDIDPSPVIHIRGLPRHSLEKDLVKSYECFGQIRDITMMPQKNQALVEYENIESAESVVMRPEPVKVLNQVVQTSYSTSKRIVQRAANRMSIEEQRTLPTDNHILLFTIYKTDRPITVDIIHSITYRYGRVVRIVIFRKVNVQAMVEFETVADARLAKLNLNGADIYTGCCTLKVDYARPTRLTVNRNDRDSWDFERSGGVAPNSLCNYPNQMNYHEPYNDSLLNDFSNLSGHINLNPYECSNGYMPSYPHQFAANMPHNIPRGNLPDGHNWMPTPVVMLYNLNMNIMNCNRVFNLLCLYGNVVRVKFLKTKEGSAMVEMGDIESALRLISNLSGIPLMDNQLVIRTSKQRSLEEVPHPYQLFDGSLSYKDFSFNRNNRYSTIALAKKNRIHPPSRLLHYWNAPPNLTADDLSNFLVSCGAAAPQLITPFSKNTGTSSTGVIQWAVDKEAFKALAICNHEEIKDPERPFPFVLKLAFANPVAHVSTGYKKGSYSSGLDSTNGLS